MDLPSLLEVSKFHWNEGFKDKLETIMYFALQRDLYNRIVICRTEFYKICQAVCTSIVVYCIMRVSLVSVQLAGR